MVRNFKLWHCVCCVQFQLKAFKIGFISALSSDETAIRQRGKTWHLWNDHDYCFECPHERALVFIYHVAKLNWLAHAQCHIFGVSALYSIHFSNDKTFSRLEGGRKMNKLFSVLVNEYVLLWPQWRILIIFDDKLINVMWPIFTRIAFNSVVWSNKRHFSRIAHIQSMPGFRFSTRLCG